jgi:hypothetical protein
MTQPGVNAARHRVMRRASEIMFARYAEARRAGVPDRQARALADDADLRAAYAGDGQALAIPGASGPLGARDKSFTASELFGGNPGDYRGGPRADPAIAD